MVSSILAPVGTPGLPAGGAVVQVSTVVGNARTNIYDAVTAPARVAAPAPLAAGTPLSAAVVHEPVEPRADKTGPVTKVVDSLKAIPGKSGLENAPRDDGSVRSPPIPGGPVSVQVENSVDAAQNSAVQNSAVQNSEGDRAQLDGTGPVNGAEPGHIESAASEPSNETSP